MPGENKSRDIKNNCGSGLKCSEKWDKLYVMSVFGYCCFSKDGSFEKFRFVAPIGSNVEKIIQEFPEDYKNRLNEAAYKDLAEKKGIQTNNVVEERARAVVNEHEEQFPKPFGPIFKLSDVEMNKYFPKVIQYVFKQEGINTQGQQLETFLT